MAKSTTRYVCQECGGVHAKWAGKCDACGAWNTLVEEVVETAPKAMKPGGGRKIDFVGLDGASQNTPRKAAGIGEFDRVLGGGLVPGSATLIGGDPGIGKSTLLLQVVARLAQTARCAYVSGEEAVDQVRLRAQRLGVVSAPVGLAAATSVRDVVASLDAADAAEVLVIDSIQTMYVDALDSAPGTVAQVRVRPGPDPGGQETWNRSAPRRPRDQGGRDRGPRVLEHMVDTVLYFEGERATNSAFFAALRTGSVRPTRSACSR